MRVVITSRGFAEKGEFQGSSSPNDPESILREAGFEVVNLSSAGFGAQSTENEIFEALKDADAAIVGLEPITESLIRRLPKLRAVTRRGIGYDSVDIDACRARGITVMRTTGAVEGAVAEHVMAYLLYFARRLDLQNQSMQSGHWERMAMPGLAGSTLGLIGFGGIGKEIARRAAPFGVRILYTCRHPDPAWEKEFGVSYAPMDELLRESDAVSVNVPLTPATRGMIGEAELSLMKPDAVLINIARGPVVDAAAVRRHLDQGTLGGAAADVFDHEPCTDSPLMGSEKAVLTPHTASFTKRNAAGMNIRAARNIAEWARGTLDPKYVVK